MAWEGSQLGTTVMNSSVSGGDVPPTDQTRKRSYAIYSDQHGRVWGANIENKTGDPCGPLEPQGWSAPILPPERFITINSRQRQLFIRYDDIIRSIDQGNSEWFDSLREHALKMYGMKAAAAIEEPPPELLDMVGPKPKARREIWEAAMDGNKWILGQTPNKPAWADEFFPPSAVVKAAKEIKPTRHYADVDEETPKAKYPRWTGPATGWQLSNLSYVERSDNEDKEAYKARAEQAEHDLEG